MEPTHSDLAIFTVCNIAYLARALVLADSVYKHSSVTLKIFIFDRKKDLGLTPANAELIWMEDLAVPNFYELAFKYDIIEFSTSLKPFITLRLLEGFKKVIFFDPDICLYQALISIIADLDEHSIVLTPHYTTPQTGNDSESDLGMMKFGSFNLGFYAVRQDEHSKAFLEWWSDRCIRFSYMETQFGLSTDQKWVTIAPCFFKSIHISFNLGYNMAPWNSFERTATKISGEEYIVNGKFPLIFFHFSNFNGEDPEYLLKRAAIEKGVRRPDLLELGLAYKTALAEKTSLVPAVLYSFDFLSGGEYISPTLRRAYAAVVQELPPHDPFDSKGIIGKFAKKNRLLQRNASIYRRSGFGDLKKHGLPLCIVYIAMRLVLRFIGPNRFFNLSRFLVFVSSYRQNKGLWIYTWK